MTVVQEFTKKTEIDLLTIFVKVRATSILELGGGVVLHLTKESKREGQLNLFHVCAPLDPIGANTTILDGTRLSL